MHTYMYHTPLTNTLQEEYLSAMSLTLPFQRWKRTFPLTEYSYNFQELLDFEGEGWKKNLCFSSCSSDTTLFLSCLNFE